MTGFVPRQVRYLNLPLKDDDAATYTPQQIILRFGDAGSIDVGAVCYLRRDENQRRSSRTSMAVAPSSFCPHRAKHVGALIAFISDEYSYSGKKPLTLRVRLHNFTCHFMAWADSSGHSGLFSDEISARQALYEYVRYLKEKVAQNCIGVNYAARLRMVTVYVLGGVLRIYDLDRGLPAISRREESTEPTVPPCEVKQSKSLALAETIFKGLSDLVQEGRPFPFRLDMPKYLQWEESHLWVFPVKMWCRLSKGHKGRAYDYTNGRLRTIGEMTALFPEYNRKENASLLRHGRARLAKANQNLQDLARLQLAAKAATAFSLLFVANTGINLADLIKLQWNDKYKCCTERQGFRTVGQHGNFTHHRRRSLTRLGLQCIDS